MVPALPEEYDGSFSYHEREKEKRGRAQARDDDSDAAEADEDPSRPPQSSSTTQPLYIHQEYPPYTSERRNSGYEEYGRPPSATHSDAHRATPSSPTVNRDQQYQFVDAHGHPHSAGNGSAQSPHSQQSPYAGAPPAAVPARFASIMNAYPEPGSPPPAPSAEFVHHNGATPAGGSAPAGGGRTHRSRKSGS